jgi:hypothetical protein
MFFAVNKAQEKFHERMSEMDRDQSRSDRVRQNNDQNRDKGEYIDYEELK